LSEPTAELRYRAAHQPHNPLWGVWDQTLEAWAIPPSHRYPAAHQLAEDLNLKEAEAAQPKPEPKPIPEEGVTTECLRSVNAFVKRMLDAGHHCWIDRGPARDGFGVFVVISLDGKTTTRSWDRPSDRWH
jgi:hypothetical protein